MERSSGATLAITPDVGSVLQIMEISFLTRPPADIFENGGCLVVLYNKLSLERGGVEGEERAGRVLRSTPT